MLVLPIKKKWFDMIINGEKKEEYREIKEYYSKRLDMKYQLYKYEKETPPFEIVFRNGYSYNSPSAKCKCTLRIDYGKKEWGAIPGQQYYVLKIIKVLEVRNHELQ